MTGELSRYPLTWPAGWTRTDPHRRAIARFRSRSGGPITVGEAVRRISDQVRKLGVPHGDWLISSNVQVRLDGLPYSSGVSTALKDPGAALYFRLFKRDQVLACDAWTTAADNMAAIAGHIEALRAIDRYKVGTLEQAFTGYTALPAKGGTWRSTLRFAPDETITRDSINARFKQLAREVHPDLVGGTDSDMKLLTEARAAALLEVLT